jgi:hypothetical protein
LKVVRTWSVSVEESLEDGFFNVTAVWQLDSEDAIASKTIPMNHRPFQSLNNEQDVAEEHEFSLISTNSERNKKRQEKMIFAFSD